MTSENPAESSSGRPGSGDYSPAEASKRMAEAARAAIAETVAKAKKISADVDAEKIDQGDIARQFVGLAGQAMVGAFRLAGTAFEVRPRRPSPEMIVLADHLAAIAQRTWKNITDVADEAAQQAAKDPLDRAAWMKSAVKLADVATIGAIEAVETATIGPVSYAPPTFNAGPFALPAANGDGKLVVVAPFRRPATEGAIDAGRIRFDPPQVSANKRQFSVVVDETGLPSGVYLGTVGIENGPGIAMTVAIRL